jgi:hypothetical protein
VDCKQIPDANERLRKKISHLEGDIPIRTESLFNELDLVEEDMINLIENCRLKNLK